LRDKKFQNYSPIKILKNKILKFSKDKNYFLVNAWKFLK
jgi:hypothetical protein